MCARRSIFHSSSEYVVPSWIIIFPSCHALNPPAQVRIYYVLDVDIVGNRVSRIVSSVSGVPPRLFEPALHESEGVLNP